MQKFHHDDTWNLSHIFANNYVMKQKYNFPKKIKCQETGAERSGT